jgi:hypothetical protein
MYEAFEQIVTSPPMPRMPSSDSDSDDVDSSLGLVLDRSATSSTASMEPMERLEGLQRVNADLSKKLVEADPRCNANSRITRVNWRRWKRAAKRQSPTQCGEMRREGAEELRTFEPDADRFPGERDCQGPKDPRQLPQNVQFVTKATKRNCVRVSLTGFIRTYLFDTWSQMSLTTCGIPFVERTRCGIVEKGRWKRASFSRRTKRTKNKSCYSNKTWVSLNKHKRA